MRKGFTLVEVCLVMLVFGVAISSIMAFFPVSLRQASMTVSDATVTTFAEYVINSLQANAAKMTDWDYWADTKADKKFRRKIVEGIRMETQGGSVALDYQNDGPKELKGYLGVEKSFIRYELDFRPSYDNHLWQIILYVTDNEKVSPRLGHTFVTHVVYLGKEPE